MKTDVRALTIFFATVLITLGFGLRELTAQTTLMPIQVGTLPTDAGYPALYARDLGYFARHGLDATITTFSSGTAMSAAVAGGTLDVGLSNPATLAQARGKGVLLKLIAPSSMAAPPPAGTDVIMVARNSPIRTGSDVNGKTVAVSALKNLTQLEAQVWIDKHGGDAKTVRFVEIPPPQTVAALESQRVDLGVVVEPFVSAARRQGQGRVIGDALESIAPRFLITGWFSRDAWIDGHQDAAVRFAAAIRDANEWANAHPAESATLMAKYSNISSDVAASMGRARFALALDPEMIRPVLDGGVRYGEIDARIDPNDLIWRMPR